MKNSRLSYGFAGAAFVLSAAIAFAAGMLSLPSEPVEVSHGGWNQGDDSTINIWLSEVPGGYDVSNGKYPGWCVEDNHQNDFNGPGVVLLDSTDTEELECGEFGYPGYPWDKINYLLNNKNGSIEDIQVAIWKLTGTYGGTFEVTEKVNAMVDDADEHGGGFVPSVGQIAAVVLCADGHSGADSYQDTLIEIRVPPRDAEGCTPGYWKQEQHFFAWDNTTPPYGQDDFYGDVFSVDDSLDLTLLQALWEGGGKEKALYRHATAGLLNAANPDVAFYYSVGDVVQMVQDAYLSGDFNYYKNLLEEQNEMGCPLDNGRHEEVEQDEAPHGGQNPHAGHNPQQEQVPHAEQNPQEEQVPHVEQNPQEEEEIQQESENPNTVRRGTRHGK